LAKIKIIFKINNFNKKYNDNSEKKQKFASAIREK